MKTGVLAVAVLVASAVLVHAQELKKGNVVGMHVSTIKLADGVTIEKFTAFFVEKAVPAYEKSWPGWKFYPVRRIRGEGGRLWAHDRDPDGGGAGQVLQRGRQPVGARQGGKCEGPADHGRDEQARHHRG